MYKFNYLTKSSDGKMSGTVSASYIMDVLMNRTITSVATANDATGIDFNLSDGGYVRFILNADSAEIVYYGPRGK